MLGRGAPSRAIRWPNRWPNRWHTGHLLLAALLLAVLLLAARAIRLLSEPLPAMPDQAAAAADDPSSALAGADPFFPTPADPGDAPVTSLPLSLHGLRLDGASGRGSAILSGDDGVQQVYKVGDSLPGGASLAALAADHILIDNGGRRESLWLDTSGGSEVERYDPGRYDPMPLPDDDGEPGQIAPSDSPAPAPGGDSAGSGASDSGTSGSAVMPAVRFSAGGGE